MNPAVGRPLAFGLWITALAATAAEPVIEPCLEPAMLVHVRADGFPVREEIELCRASLDTRIFEEQAPIGVGGPLPLELRRDGSGAALRFKPEDGDPLIVELDANGTELRVEGFPGGGALWVRLESKPLPEDPLSRTLAFRVVSLPVADVVERIARVIGHRIEGAERLCDAKVSLDFEKTPLSVRQALALLAFECDLRIDRSGEGVIRIDGNGHQPWAEPPPGPAERLLADLEDRLSAATGSAEATRLLAQADLQLAAIDPDRIGPEWLALTRLAARHGPPSERLSRIDAALDLHGRQLPTDRSGLREHDRQTAEMLSTRAEALIVAGRPAEALAAYERAISLDAFEPELMARAEALIAPAERAAWWQRQRGAADRLLDEVASGTDEYLVDRYDPERHAIVQARAAHSIAVDALLAGRYGEAAGAWSHVLFQRAERLGADHRRVRDAQLEYALLVELSHSLARSPAEIPLPDPPLSVDRGSPDPDAPLLDRLLDRDLLDAGLVAAIDARLAAAATPQERARLSVLAAEVALTRDGAAALDAAIGHYRTALGAHVPDDFDRHLLTERLGLLERWAADRP